MIKHEENVLSVYRYFKVEEHFVKKISYKFVVSHINNTVRFSFAVCSESDNFSRQTARKLLDERMKNNQVIVGDYDSNESLIHNANRIVNELFCGIQLDDDIDNKRKKEIRDISRLINAYDDILFMKSLSA